MAINIMISIENHDVLMKYSTDSGVGLDEWEEGRSQVSSATGVNPKNGS
jgi:hypothetical protein